MVDDGRTDRRWRRWAIAGWTAVAVMLFVPFTAMFVMAATADDENVVVTRNAVAGHMWRGAITNVTAHDYGDVTVQVVFVDRDGLALSAARAHRAVLRSGATMDLSAPLPAGAAALRLFALRWRRDDGRAIAVGPYAQWDFGHVHTRLP